MSDYLFYLNQDRTPVERYFMEGNPGEGYAFEGIEYWNRHMSTLLDVLSEKVTKERLNEVKTNLINSLLQLDNITDYNVYDDPLSLLSGRSLEELILTLLLRLLRRERENIRGNPCPRLFISHRQADKDYALRLAYLARQCGFAFWVDVLDPDLHNASGKNLDSLYIACKIEMALLNCTHVIACMTPDTRGGMWVPYEYGRIRKFPGLSINTCTWLHPDIKNDPIPEFMCLGIRAFEETYIQQWLGREYAIWNKANCKLQKHNFQELENTKPLPIETSEELNKRELKENSNPNMELRSVMKILKRLERKYLKSD